MSLLVCICPAMRAGRSVKHTVTGFTPRRTSFPLLKLTFFAFCTKRTSTFFDCLPLAVQVISAFALGAGVGDAAKAAKGFTMMMPANAPHIRMSLFILIGREFDLRFIGSSSVGLVSLAFAIETTRGREARLG